SQEVLAEAALFGKRVARDEIPRRMDLRELCCITIDPDTAKDFDDAISIQPRPSGGFELGVHIADVSHYVAQGSALDSAARVRGNSTYLPGSCLPMLPKNLSELLCSLRPQVNRLAVSVLFTLDAAGNCEEVRFTKSVIKSSARLTYGQVREILNDQRRSPYKEMILEMKRLCELLQHKRSERGSVHIELPDLILSIGPDGIPTGIHHEPYDLAHQMIEELMLLANEAVAKELDRRGYSVTYRIHEEPDPEDLRDFAHTVSCFGFELPEKPSQEQIQELFRHAVDSPYYPQLTTAYIRSMKMAYYSPSNIGHFGLSLTHYCHFTSPIRRYVDLVVHRLLFDHPVEEAEIQAISRSCSETERHSARAENHVRLLKKLRFLKGQHESGQRYRAVISKIKRYGVVFELPSLQLEGFLHISEVGDDYYRYDFYDQSLKGRTSGEKLCAGDELDLDLLEVDLIHLTTHWARVSEKPMRDEGHRPRRMHSQKREKREKQETKTEKKHSASKHAQGKQHRSRKAKKPKSGKGKR
ncbi:MAG: VacB/RNase II family 3'-5' exoribonuclease, partial [Chlamydiia bacterium]|nr:VacB/RNase II family 3'-5' exoribonuclease [Chlamydiia bacterium]